MADLNKKNPSVTEDALDIHLDASGNIDRISGHGIAGTGGGGGSINYYGDDVYIKNTDAAENIFTLTDSVKVKLDQIKSYTQGTDIIVDENNTIQVNTNGSANSTGMAFVEGSDNIASGVASHAEGKLNSAMSDYSHIEGYKNIDFEIPGQIGSNHTEGAYNDVSGVYTHIEGHANGASGYGLHVQGGYNQFVIHNMSANKSDPDGRWNIWGISIEGMANATTAEPYSGTIGEPDFGYIHGGILKVIGNGTRTKTDESDPSTEVINRSDALIIYRDGSISAAGNISANGIELGAGGGGTSYQGRKGVNVDGGYIELTQTTYNAVTSIAGLSTDVGTLKVASADWNKISAKLDTTAFSTVSGNFLTEEDLTEYATKSDLEIASGELLTTAQYQNDSATFLTAVPDTYALKTDIPRTVAQLTDSGNYYQKTETSSKDELSTEFAKYVTSSNVSTPNTDYVMTTTGWKVLTLPSGGMTQVYHDTTLTGDGNANDNQLGVVWSALSGNTIDSAKSAGSATSALSAYKAASASASKRLQDSTDGPVIQVGDVTALQHWASSNSSTWEGVTAKLGTAQYATDSATFVTSSISTITGTKQYALTTTGWAEITGGSVGDDYVPYSAINLAIGSEVVASAYSFAQGWDNSANWNSVTFGTHSTAYSRSLAVGENAFADSHSLSIGGGANSHCNSADGQSIAVGNGVSARYRSIAVGSHSTVADTNALSIGAYCIASGTGSVAIGYQNSAYNLFDVGGGQAFGGGLEISGGLAIGYYNATKDAAFVIGDGNEQGNVITRSDSFVIYRDGSVSAKGDITANGVKLGGGGSSFTGASANNGLSGNGLTSSPLGLHSSAAKTISATKYEEINTNMLAQKLLVVTSDQQIINYVQGGGANNEGCIFFVTSAHS